MTQKLFSAACIFGYQMNMPMIGSRNHRPSTVLTGLWRPSRWYIFSISLGTVKKIAKPMKM